MSRHIEKLALAFLLTFTGHDSQDHHSQEREHARYTETIPGTDLSFDMVPIPAGSFLMGSPEGENQRGDHEGPQRKVKISAFWMGRCEVTWEEYDQWSQSLEKKRRAEGPTSEADELADAVTRPTPPYTDMTFGMGSEGYPAICMTQLAAKKYCEWLSAKTGKFYRLPTEAEWEYACRAGTETAYWFGDDPAELADHEWYGENSPDSYQKVGLKKPNPWGLHDIAGNVAEWTLDGYAPYEPAEGGEALSDPLHLPTSLYPRVARGGSWQDDADLLRSAARTASHPDWKMQDPQLPQSKWYHTDAPFLGFRVVRPVDAPEGDAAEKYRRH
ncbi:MAG: formylglycine-generating enzyme family protein [Planctomycetota bacterium]|jgi:formylglycine-generating enzyme required for sulfatase activity